MKKHLYTITYTEGPDGETETVRERAYDYEHAEDKFLTRMELLHGGNEGIHIISIFKVPTVRQAINSLFRS